MLADPRAKTALVDDFSSQWLNLRRVDEVVAHPDFYPDFDDNLLAAFTQETRLFIDSTLNEDRSVSDLLRADLHVRERTPGASLQDSWHLRHALPPRHAAVQAARRPARPGAILATTSYPDRTSPVLRGKWLLDNIFGVYVPPPPPDVNTTLPGSARHAAADDPRAAVAASHESRLRQLPRRHRSARLRARELRCDRRLAHHR
jgi:hypothetical protein